MRCVSRREASAGEALLLEARADRRAPPRRLARDLRRKLNGNKLATLSERAFEGLSSLTTLCVRVRVVCVWCVSRREACVG